MFGFEEKTKFSEVNEMLEEMEVIYSELRLEYLDMARRYDDAVQRIGELEADKLDLEDALAGREASLGWQ